MPVPTVPEIAVENASNCETDLTRLSFSFFLPKLLRAGTIVVFSDSPNFLTCRNFVRMVSRIPVPRIRMTTGHPQTMPLRKLLTFSMVESICSHINILLFELKTLSYYSIKMFITQEKFYSIYMISQFAL